MSDNVNNQQNSQPQQRPATVATSTIQTPKSDNAAISYADKLAKEVQDKQFNAAQRRQMGLGENNALIAVYQTAESNLTPEQKKKKEEEALKRALKTSSKLIKRMAELDAQREKFQELADKARARAAEIRESQEYLDTFDALEEIDDALMDFNREEAKKLLKKRGVDIPNDATDAQIIALLIDEQTKERIRFEAYNNEIAEQERIAAEYDAKVDILDREKERLLENDAKSIPFEISDSTTPDEVRALFKAATDLDNAANQDTAREFDTTHENGTDKQTANADYTDISFMNMTR